MNGDFKLKNQGIIVAYAIRFFPAYTCILYTFIDYVFLRVYVDCMWVFKVFLLPKCYQSCTVTLYTRAFVQFIPK